MSLIFKSGRRKLERIFIQKKISFVMMMDYFIPLHYDQIIVSNTVTGSGLHNGNSNNLPILQTTSAGPGRTYSATCITKSILGAKLENSPA